MDANGSMYIVMELCDYDLHKFVTGVLNFKPKHQQYEWIINISRQIVQGMHGICSSEILHGDMKPENVLIHILDKKLLYVMNVKLLLIDMYSVKIADMGLARDLTEITSPSRSAHTQGIGTVGYRAPEVYRLKDNKNKASDIWSTGCVIAWMFAGQRPFG